MKLEYKTEEEKRQEIEEKEKLELERQEKKEEKITEKMKFGQKIQWFWEYHKWYVIIPIAVLVAGVYTYFCFIREVGPTYLRATMINATMSDETDVTFDDLFMEEKQVDSAEGAFRLDTGLIHPEVIDDSNSGDTVVVASVQKYNGLIVNGTTDVTITSDWVVKEFAPSGSYCNLKEVLPEEFYKKIEDRIYVCQGPDDEIPVGIRLDGVQEVMKFYEEQAVPVIAISSRSQQTEHAIEFVMWLFR